MRQQNSGGASSVTANGEQLSLIARLDRYLRRRLPVGLINSLAVVAFIIGVASFILALWESRTLNGLWYTYISPPSIADIDVSNFSPISGEIIIIKPEVSARCPGRYTFKWKPEGLVTGDYPVFQLDTDRSKRSIPSQINLRAIVEDECGGMSSQYKQVPPINIQEKKYPKPELGGILSNIPEARPGDPVFFVAYGAKDPEGNTLHYQWEGPVMGFDGGDDPIATLDISKLVPLTRERTEKVGVKVTNLHEWSETRYKEILLIPKPNGAGRRPIIKIGRSAPPRIPTSGTSPSASQPNPAPGTEPSPRPASSPAVSPKSESAPIPAPHPSPSTPPPKSSDQQTSDLFGSKLPDLSG